jgi:hypothetical protein
MSLYFLGAVPNSDFQCSVVFPSLTSVDEISIFREVNLDCTPAHAAFNRSHPNGVGGAFSCLATIPKSTKKTLPVSAKDGIVVGIVLPITLTLFFLWVRWMFRREKAAREKHTSTALALEPRHLEEDGDHAPDYNSVARTEAGSVHSEATAVQAQGLDEPLLEHAHREAT